MKALTKTCRLCKKRFTKSQFCSLRTWKDRTYCSRRCAYDDRENFPSPKKGKSFPHLRFTNREFNPCRVCSRPTRYQFTKNDPRTQMVRCTRSTCVEASKKTKNARIQQAMISLRDSGKRKDTSQNWKNVSRIGPEEKLLLDWFTHRKWVHQFHVRTGLSVKKHLPACFDLDFALPSKKLYVEIDGTTHQLPKRKEKDAKRDSILSELGWKGLRIPASAVCKDIQKVKQQIVEFQRSLNYRKKKCA